MPHQTFLKKSLDQKTLGKSFFEWCIFCDQALPVTKFSSTFFKRWRSQGRAALVAPRKGRKLPSPLLFWFFSLAADASREKNKRTQTGSETGAFSPLFLWSQACRQRKSLAKRKRRGGISRSAERAKGAALDLRPFEKGRSKLLKRRGALVTKQYRFGKPMRPRRAGACSRRFIVFPRGLSVGLARFFFGVKHAAKEKA